MPRHIDAELLLRKSIQERRFFIYTENLIKGGYDVQTVYNDLAEFVESIPAADVVEVVRCCTCKYSEPVGDIGCHCQNRKTPWFNDEFEVYMNLDDFCSYGERKEK